MGVGAGCGVGVPTGAGLGVGVGNGAGVAGGVATAMGGPSRGGMITVRESLKVPRKRPEASRAAILNW